jgi:hypothetical protein
VFLAWILHFPHRSYGTKALARQCFDKALSMAGIADRASSYIQARQMDA